MRLIVLKLLKQETVSQAEWQDLFYGVHLVCLWDEKGASKIHDCLRTDIVEFIVHAQKKVQSQRGEQALLMTYIIEWRKFFTQSSYLPLPFRQLEQSLQCKASSSTSSASTSAGTSSSATTSSSQQKKNGHEDSIVRKLMLDSWNANIFCDIKDRLQESAMKIVHAERNGDAYDSLLVIGVRESYVNLSSNMEDKLQIYRDYFEAAYLKATASFYRLKAAEQQQANGVLAFMKYADAKLREEEARAKRYLEPSSYNVLAQTCVRVLVGDHMNTIIAECAPLIREYETERLNLMFRLLDRVQNGVDPMLRDLESHIVSAGLADMLSASEIITQDSEKYVERLLELFKKFSALVKNAFNDDPRFLTARDKAFKTVVNDTSVFKVIEMAYSILIQQSRKYHKSTLMLHYDLFPKKIKIIKILQELKL